MQSYLINSFDWSFPPEQASLAGGEPLSLSHSFILSLFLFSMLQCSSLLSQLRSTRLEAPRAQLTTVRQCARPITYARVVLDHFPFGALTLCVRLAQGGHGGTNKCAPKVHLSFSGPSPPKTPPPKSVVLSRLAVTSVETEKWTSKHKLSVFKFERAPHLPAVLAIVAVVPRCLKTTEFSSISISSSKYYYHYYQSYYHRQWPSVDCCCLLLFYIFCCFIIFLFFLQLPLQP